MASLVEYDFLYNFLYHQIKFNLFSACVMSNLKTWILQEVRSMYFSLINLEQTSLKHNLSDLASFHIGYISICGALIEILSN